MSAVRRRSSAEDHAHEPDYRFTPANERTFLAWIRMLLALIVGGVALVQLVPRFGVHGVEHALSVVLMAAGGTLAALAVRHWQRVQHAMRHDMPLRNSRLPIILVVSLLAVTLVLSVLLVASPLQGG